MKKESDIDAITFTITDAIKGLVASASDETVSVSHYGANHIHPRHLVIWVCVQSDSEKQRLSNDSELNSQLRELLTLHEYPEAGRDEVLIGFESKETVDRDSNGNWYQHWK